MSLKILISSAAAMGLFVVAMAARSTEPTGTGREMTIQDIMDDGAKIEKIAGDFKFTEGPVWDKKGFLLFSDIPADTIYKWAPEGKPEVFRKPSGHANGNTFDKQGRLISCEHDRRVTRREKDGKITILAERYNGKRLNSPNDVVVKSDGSIYFTDPPYGLSSKDQEELGFYGVYRLAADGTVTLLDKDFDKPNGLTFSPDESRLYVNDTDRGHIRVFDMQPDGTVANGRVFAELKMPGKAGAPDGMKVDVKGNVYCTGPEGVWIFTPAGKLLGKIIPAEVPANIGWGDKENKTLYMTAQTGLYRIRLKIAGTRP